MHDLAKIMGVSLFGFTKNPRPEYYDPFKPFVFNQMITGCAYGVIKSENTHWNEELKLKEDFWISGIVKYYERKILVDTRFNFNQKDTFVNVGGLAEIRNELTEMENMLLIKKHFGDSIKIKREQSKAKLKKKYNISFNFRF